MNYTPAPNRYDRVKYRRCGNSGLLLPEISLGLWHNFGDIDDYQNSREMLLSAFDMGITHFDIANNYGPPPGSAERRFGDILRNDLLPYRDELIISSKSGYLMWDGPYGDWGSRKQLIASINQSLKRTGLEYFDIFYHHRPDINTPIEETMRALEQIVKSGKALYVGLSNYQPEQLSLAMKILDELGTPCIIEQSKYSMFVRKPEEGLIETAKQNGAGFIAFSPLAQGLLSDKYLKGIPEGSRATRNHFLKQADISQNVVDKIYKLNEIAVKLDMTLAQLAVKWILRSEEQFVTSVLIGASRVSQIQNIVGGVGGPNIPNEMLAKIDEILAE